MTSRPSASVLNDLDRLAAPDRQHVAEAHRLARRHVVGAHQVAGHGRRAAERPQRDHRAEDRGRAGHVLLHREMHRVGRLEADAAGVVHDPLADEREVAGRRGRLAVGAGRAVRQLDHPRRLVAAHVDAEQPAAAELDEGVLVEDLDLEAGLRRRGPWRPRPCASRSGGWPGCCQVAGDLDGLGQRPARARRPPPAPAPALGPGDQRQRRSAAPRWAGRRRRDSGSGPGGRLRRWPARRPPRPASRDIGQRRREVAVARRGPGERGGGVAQARRVERRRDRRRRPRRRPGGPPRGRASVWPRAPVKPLSRSEVAARRRSPGGTSPSVATGIPSASGTARGSGGDAEAQAGGPGS